MRRLVIALGLLGPVTGACAGDFDWPVLRGSSRYPVVSPAYARWQGFYGGGQMGYGNAHANFAQATQSLVAFSLRTTALENEQHPSQWQVLGAADTKTSSIGGFVGYNSQWEEVVLGMELNYNRSSFAVDAPNSPITRVTSAGGNAYVVTVSGSGSMRVTDFATARLRGGWVIGNFMPYVTGGIAVGRGAVARSATVSGIENPTTPPTPCNSSAAPPCTPFSFTESEAKSSAFIYGWALGAGVDFLVLPNVFLRGEVEYVTFIPISNITANVTTARVGVGIKF
jgi:opacity protein-like surface antigen